MQVLANTLYCS